MFYNSKSEMTFCQNFFQTLVKKRTRKITQKKSACLLKRKKKQGSAKTFYKMILVAAVPAKDHVNLKKKRREPSPYNF